MLLSVKQVSKSYGPDVILKSIDFAIEKGEKVAVVGRNGCGKSTLLKIIAGEIELDGGSVRLSRGAKVGYLSQVASSHAGQTVLEVAQSAVAERLALADRLSQLQMILDSGRATSHDLDEFALLHEHVDVSEGYAIERDLSTVLERVGIEQADLAKAADSLSGGEKTRLALARLLLQEPDLLILDEPTNHLDLQATEWLEGWVKGYHGAVLFVSHDRTFLEAVAGRLLDMRDGAVKSYPGPFTKYRELLAAELKRKALERERTEAEIAELDEFVRRFMNSQRTAQARGREKIMKRKIAELDPGAAKQGNMQAGFGKAERGGEIVASFEKAAIGYGKPLIPQFDWTVRHGERWGVIGENGAGKSTLIKAMLGRVAPLKGGARLGSNIRPGYFAQDAEELDLERSSLDVLVGRHGLLPEVARNLLGRFLISGDDVHRKVKTLSGGERNKLSLAVLTAIKPNLLVLDEPTNHLDIESREALCEVLGEFNGTLILVSHDRWLLGQVTDKTLDVKRSGVVEFDGSYDEYRGWVVGRRPSAVRPGVLPKKSSPRLMSPREVGKQIERLERLVAEQEASIDRLEFQIRDVEASLSRAPEIEKVRELSALHEKLSAELNSALEAWEACGSELHETLASRQS